MNAIIRSVIIQQLFRLGFTANKMYILCAVSVNRNNNTSKNIVFFNYVTKIYTMDVMQIALFYLFKYTMVFSND